MASHHPAAQWHPLLAVHNGLLPVSDYDASKCLRNSKDAIPSISAAALAASTVQNGQKACTTRSAINPAQVRVRGRRSRFKTGVMGRSWLGILCTVQGPDTPIVSQPLWDGIAIYHLVKGRSRANDGELMLINKHLGDQKPRIVFRRHHCAIGTCRPKCDEFVRFYGRHGALAGECIAGFADRPNNINRLKIDTRYRLDDW